MKCFQLILFLLFLLPILSQAQGTTQNIRGTIIDKDTRQPIEGVRIMTLDKTPPIAATFAIRYTIRASTDCRIVSRVD